MSDTTNTKDRTLWFTTRTECIDYLINHGADSGIAKAALDQYCNYEPDNDKRDLIWRGHTDLDETCVALPSLLTDPMDSDHTPCEVTPAFVESVYYTFSDMAIIWNNCIYFDREPMYYRDGTILPIDVIKASPDQQDALAIAAVASRIW